MVYYDGKYSLTFIDPDTPDMETAIYGSDSKYRKNTWVDWGLIPSNRPSISPPSRKTEIIEIPGINGQRDISIDYFGHPVFSNRTGTIEFILVNKNLDLERDYKKWDYVYSEMMNFLNSKKLYVILDDEKDFFYEGYFSVNDFKSSKLYSTIVIDYSLDPYKKTISVSNEPWLWDPFSFENGVIQDYIEDFTPNGSFSITKDFYVYANAFSELIIDIEKAADNDNWNDSSQMLTVKNGNNSYPFGNLEQTTIRKYGETIFECYIKNQGTNNIYSPKNISLCRINFSGKLTNKKVKIKIRGGSL